MKWVKYTVIFVVSVILLAPAFCCWIVRGAANIAVKLVVDWPCRKAVYGLMAAHEWILTALNFHPQNPLRTPRIPQI